MTEAEFQAAVIQLAKYCGWLVHAERPARSSRGWCTPIQGDAGWVDLVLCRDGKLLLVELKSDGGKTTPGQDRWLSALVAAGQDVRLWRPAYWDGIVAVLQR